MEIFDTHFHFGGGESFDAFLERCRADLLLASAEYRVKPDRLRMLCAAGDFSDAVRARAFAEHSPEVFFACGVHPHEARKFLDGGGEDFSVFRGHGKLLAVGEIGLDYFYDLSDRQAQKEVLEKFLKTALEWELPAMLHLRDRDGASDAYDDALAMLTDFSADGGRFVIHCYAGDGDYAERFLALGGFFGVTGMVTFKAAENIRRALEKVPDDRLLIETDSPYLAPVPYRGRNNTPGMTALVAQALGAVRGMTPEAAAERFSGNGRRFYRVGEWEDER